MGGTIETGVKSKHTYRKTRRRGWGGGYLFTRREVKQDGIGKGLIYPLVEKSRKTGVGVGIKRIGRGRGIIYPRGEKTGTGSELIYPHVEKTRRVGWGGGSYTRRVGLKPHASQKQKNPHPDRPLVL